MEWVAQRGYIISILGDTQNLTEHSPEHSALGGPARKMQLD